MKVLIVGAHGKVARHLTPRLVEGGHEVVGLVRNPDHVADLESDGAAPVVLDIETATSADLSPHVRGADAVVFAAGAGGKGGSERKQHVDRDGALKLADAASVAGVRRYLLVSAMGLQAVVDGATPDGVEPGFVEYLRAKLEAEDALRSRPELDLTVLRPGHLLDDEGTGSVTLSRSTLEVGGVPRADVAAVLVALLQAPGTAGQTLELVSGDVPVEQAVAALA
ncbi:SDR family oxidoreductase [uncultured Pseudokineococcus sp.]|uniref:SDR family oxidoreductase n=1 Tax=uncultured Pseudokineococcus sp. TaxID=1642928 RepID=UPI002633E55D|nr:SDR family oxidoreductase [uncultured Pseudokineococcus sp.]